MSKTLINEFGQKVREYTWEEYQQRVNNRIPYRGDVDLNGKILVVKHTWGIGDVLYSTAALHAIKEKFPNVDIRYICTNPEVLEGNPSVNKIYHWLEYQDFVEISDDLDRQWYWLDYDVPLKGGYDYKIHLRTKMQLNERLAQMLRQNPKTLNQDERNFVDQASSSVISRYKMVALDMYCWHAFVDPPDKTVYYYPTEREVEVAQNFLAPIRKKGKKAILLMPHASTPYKDYPHWRKVIDLCPKEYYWVIMDSHMRAGSWSGSSNIYDASGAFRMRHSIAVAIEADLMCSSDTGMLYPRAARGKPCVVTYGPHEPEPFLHYFPSAHGLRVPHLTETPGMEGMCSVGCYIDTQSCHISGDPAPCLNELSPERVAAKVMELMGK
jgi:ADP-heptose:LPS heptosyltransferase